MLWKGKEITVTDKKEKDKYYNAQEEADYYYYNKFIQDRTNNNVSVTKARQGMPYDATQTENTWIEIKARHRYSINDFPTMDLSLYKIDRLKTYVNLNEEQQPDNIYLAVLWTKDNKITLHNITDITLDDEAYENMKNSNRLIYKYTSFKTTDDNNKKFKNTLIQFPLDDKRYTTTYSYDLSDYWNICEQAFNSMS